MSEQTDIVLTRPCFLKNPCLKLSTNKTESLQLKLSWCTEMTKEPNFLTVCEIFGHLWNLDLTTLITWYFCVKTRLRHTVIYKKRKKVKKERFFLKKNKSFNLFRGLWSSSSGIIEVSMLKGKFSLLILKLQIMQRKSRNSAIFHFHGSSKFCWSEVVQISEIFTKILSHA